MSTVAETLAVALRSHQAGDLRQAEQLYRHILQIEPQHVDALHLLGLLAYQVGRSDLAVAYIGQALRLRPDFAEAHNHLGTALAAQGKLDEAEPCYQQALRLRPDYAEVHNNLGNVLTARGKPAEAVASYKGALRFQPDYAEAHCNLGSALTALGQLEEAVICYRMALRLKPDFAQAHNSLGNAFLVLGKLDEAVASCRQALRLKPNYTSAHSNLLFALTCDSRADPAAVFAEHRGWGEQHLRIAQVFPSPDRDRNPQRRLRLGYVSPDLRQHAVTRYFEPVLTHHDPQQVEVYCYAEVAAADAVTARLQELAHGWRWTHGHSAAEVADWIRADGIDILVDLAGHTAHNRLDVFALKPAPVQATWLGYMNTTGLSTVDYRLTDDVLDPPGLPVLDSEQLFRLPGGSCCFAPPKDAPGVGPLPALARGHLTFGSLHKLAKLNAGVFDLWCRVLQALPTARLLMFRDTLVGETRDFIRRQFTERGIAEERLDLRQGSAAPGYLEIYEEIDISLDTFPYSGGTTTCEALWMGVPMLSLCGLRPASRGSAALLASVGLSDWAVQTPVEYVAMAVRWANDLERLAQMRSGLRERMSATLCNAGRFTRVLEDGYRTMWRRWCAQRDGKT